MTWHMDVEKTADIVDQIARGVRDGPVEAP
jgi:hypothetical protein